MSDAFSDDVDENAQEIGAASWTGAPELDEELTALLTLFRKPVYRFILHHVQNHWDAEDLTQQTMYSAIGGFDQFRGDSKPSTWLYGIAQNIVMNFLSRERRRQLSRDSDDCLRLVPCERPDPMAQRALNQMITLVQQEVNLLPPKLSTPLLLVAINERSYEDVAQALDIPLGTVRSRLSRARAALRNSIGSASEALAA